MKGGLLKTEEKTRARRRIAPAWASQPVPFSEKWDVSELKIVTVFLFFFFVEEGGIQDRDE